MGKVDLTCDHLVGDKTDASMAEGDKRAHHEASGDKKGKRESNFADDKGVPPSGLLRADPGCGSALTKTVLRGYARCAHRRKKTKEDGGDTGCNKEEEANFEIDVDLVAKDDGVGKIALEQMEELGWLVQTERAASEAE